MILLSRILNAANSAHTMLCEMMEEYVVKNKPLQDNILESAAINKSFQDNFRESANVSRNRNQKRRAFTEVSMELHPYRKKIKITNWNDFDISQLNKTAENWLMSKELDVTWMLLNMHKIVDVSM